MALFAKKQELEHKVGADAFAMPPPQVGVGVGIGLAPQMAPQMAPVPHRQPAPPPPPQKAGYGIQEAIRLMRSLPVDQHPDLVVAVVRTTLASLNVLLPDIIEDASRKQKAVQDRISSEHQQVAELEKQLDARRKEIASLEADLEETTHVKERLQLAEKSAMPVTPTPGPTIPMPALISSALLNGGAKPE